mmetsp:Transcript_2078/g.5284  ORF Transcript_2078/g.5284 Transcript_2078/m.5284 type:complete len:311 (-) Transcript_2078:614-1546(-)
MSSGPGSGYEGIAPASSSCCCSTVVRLSFGTGAGASIGVSSWWSSRCGSGAGDSSRLMADRFREKTGLLGADAGLAGRAEPAGCVCATLGFSWMVDRMLLAAALAMAGVLLDSPKLPRRAGLGLARAAGLCPTCPACRAGLGLARSMDVRVGRGCAGGWGCLASDPAVPGRGSMMEALAAETGRAGPDLCALLERILSTEADRLSMLARVSPLPLDLSTDPARRASNEVRPAIVLGMLGDGEPLGAALAGRIFATGDPAAAAEARGADGDDMTVAPKAERGRLAAGEPAECAEDLMGAGEGTFTGTRCSF